MTVYFISSDTQIPHGGIKQCYRAVDALNRTGIKAAIVHNNPSFRAAWFNNHTHIVGANETLLRADDVVVVTEYLANQLLPVVAPGIRKILFNQAPYLTFRNAPIPFTEKDLEPFRNPELIGCITVSEDGRSLLRTCFPHLPIQRVYLGIDPTDFRSPGPATKKKIICLTQRKRPADARLLMALLRAGARCTEWEVRILENMHSSEVALSLRESAIFLHLPATPGEGFSLLAAEAMCAGCLVIGYNGRGAAELMTSATSVTVDEGDIAQFAREIEIASQSFGSPAWTPYENKILAATTLVDSHYTSEQYSKSIVGAIQILSSTPAPHYSGTQRLNVQPIVSRQRSRWLQYAITSTKGRLGLSLP